MFEFNASIFGRELPVGLGVVGIAVVFPSGDFAEHDSLRASDRMLRADQASIAAAR